MRLCASTSACSLALLCSPFILPQYVDVKLLWLNFLRINDHVSKLNLTLFKEKTETKDTGPCGRAAGDITAERALIVQLSEVEHKQHQSNLLNSLPLD